MKKFILFFILSIIFIFFIALFSQVYIQQKGYFNLKNQNNTKEIELNTAILEIPSRYLDYSLDEYDKAILDKRVVVLFFTSNWCTKCNNQDVVNNEVFDSLNKEGVVGQRIHILDSDTTVETDAIARKFDVVKENTLVVLNRNGAVYFKNTGDINKEELISILQKAGDI